MKRFRFGLFYAESSSNKLRRVNTVSTSIFLLLTTCGPMTIFRRVGTIVFFAIERVVIAWTKSHISQEVFKRIEPSLTHSNPSTTIVRIPRIFRIDTASFNIGPCPILRRVTHAVSFIKCKQAGFTDFPTITTTTFGSSTFQRGSRDYFFFSTIATAQPSTTMREWG